MHSISQDDPTRYPKQGISDTSDLAALFGREPTGPGAEYLAARGISEITRDFFHIRPNGTGWLYPANADQPDLTRFKGYPGTEPKYKWHPRKPADLVMLYDPNGTLAAEIAGARGSLILCEGEPDVWALAEAGIFNATATMLGAATVPAWLVDEVIRLGARQVVMYPDRDPAGAAYAAKVTAALESRGVKVEARELPATLGEKGDINDLLLAVGPEGLQAALEACGPAALPDVTPVAVSPRFEAYSGPQTDASGLFEQWALEVERQAVATWQIAPPKANGWSRRNFSAPQREDRRASATWNYTRHGYKDHGTGAFFNTHEVAALIGFEPWQDYKARQRPAPRPESAAAARFALGMPYTLTKRLNMAARLFGLPSQTPAALVLHAWQLISRDVLPDGAPVTQADFRKAAESAGFELSRETVNRGFQQLAEWGAGALISPPNCDHDSGAKCAICNLYLKTLNKYRLQKTHLASGRKPTLFLFNPVSVAMRGFVDRYTGLIAALRYGDTPANAELVWRDLTADEARLANRLSAPLYEATASAREKAAALFEADLTYLRADAARIVAGERYHVPPLGSGRIDSPAAYVRALVAGAIQAAGKEGVKSYTLRGLTGISRATLARAVDDLAALSLPQERQARLSDLTPRDLALVKRTDGEKAVLHAPSVIKLAERATDAERERAERHAAAQKRRAALRRAHHPETHSDSPIQNVAKELQARQVKEATRRRKEAGPADFVREWQRLQLDLRLPADLPRHDPATGELYAPGQLFSLAAAHLAGAGQKRPADAPQGPTRRESERRGGVAPVAVCLQTLRLSWSGPAAIPNLIH